MPRLNIFIEDPNLLQRALQETRESYRPLDPGWYLYKKLLKYDIQNKFSNDFIELVYVTLSAWNMNSRGAKLQEYDQFKNSIVNCRNVIEGLNEYSIENISEQNIIDRLYELFSCLNLVADNKPKLVTYSKAFHFFMPNLVGPIDRKYTLQFFYGHTNVPKRTEKQFDKFIEIEKQYSNLISSVDLHQYIDNNLNSKYPKIVDNIIIGYQRLNMVEI